MGSKIMAQYYKLSEALGDDQYLLATAIQRFHYEPLHHSSILGDLQNSSPDRLAKFTETFDYMMGISKEMIQEAAKDTSFSSIECYVSYLQSILDINGIAFCEYNHSCKVKKEQKGLF